MIREAEAPSPLPEGQLGVSFENASFTYPSAEDVSLGVLLTSRQLPAGTPNSVRGFRSDNGETPVTRIELKQVRITK